MFGPVRRTKVLLILTLFGAILLLTSVALLYHVPVTARQKRAANGTLRQNSHQFFDMSCPSLEKVLLYLGFLSKKADWGFAETMFKGGALGELVVWSDLIATLYLLGHDVKVATEFEELSQHLYILNGTDRVAETSPSCTEPDSIIYTDIVGLVQINEFMHIPEHRYKCRVRVFDCFGTEAAYNHKAFSVRRKQVSGWGGKNLRLQLGNVPCPIALFRDHRFMTGDRVRDARFQIPDARFQIPDANYLANADTVVGMTHTPDDTFLGFVVGSVVEVGKQLKKENIAVVYGKTFTLWQGKSSFLKQFHDHGFEVHGTVGTNGRTEKLGPMPDFIINHGFMRNGSFQLLLKQAKIYIGLGKPYEGPAPLEAIANGAVFVNPKFDPPFDYRKNDKPTDRALTSQNPYVEQFMGEPYAYTVNIDNKEEVERVIQKIIKTDVFAPFLPYEYSDEGFIQRINGYVEHQDFCHYGEQFWPPQSAVKMIIANIGVSCKDACWENNLICEPSYFQHINSTEAFLQTNNIRCTQTRTEADIYHPSLIHNNTQCILQSDDLLFSCVGGKQGHRRLCPCRTFIRYRSGLCKGCDR